MDFYYAYFSGNSARAAFGIAEMGVPCQMHGLDARAHENRSPDYTTINPVGKVPSLVDGAMKLWESNAINWYVAEKFPAAGLLPTTIEGRASVQRWLFFQAAHVTPACVPVFRATNARVHAYWGGKVDEKAVEHARKELARYLPVLEGTLSKREWLEDKLSLADIAYAPHMLMVLEGGFDFSPYPGVRAWLERLQARPAWKKTAEMIFAG
jgi:glutathione S-transferase